MSARRMGVSHDQGQFRLGDTVTAGVSRAQAEGIGMTSSAKAFLDINTGDVGVVHEVGADGTLWVRFEKPQAAAGSLWPFRPEQLRHGAEPASAGAEAGG